MNLFISITEAVELVEAVCSKKETIRMAGNNFPRRRGGGIDVENNKRCSKGSLWVISLFLFASHRCIIGINTEKRCHRTRRDCV